MLAGNVMARVYDDNYNTVLCIGNTGYTYYAYKGGLDAHLHTLVGDFGPQGLDP